MMQIVLNGQSYRVNESGYLVDPADWNLEIAQYLATRERLEMSDAHWEVVKFLRNYYEEHKIVPMIRTMLKAIGAKFGQEKANIRYLYDLYPCGPLMQALKIAGLPMPCGCD